MEIVVYEGSARFRGQGVFILVLVMLGALFAWPGETSAGTASPFSSVLSEAERDWLSARGGVIRISPDPNFPPIEWIDETGMYRGFVADYFKLLEARLGVRFELVVRKTWDEVLHAARRRDTDLVTAAQITPEREAYLAFTTPIIDVPNVIIVRHETPGAEKFDNMKGMRIAITRGNALHEYLAMKYPDMVLIPAADDLAGLQLVSFNRADATVVNLAIASWLIEKHGFANLRMAGDSGKSNPLAIACRNDEPLLKTIMEKGMAMVREEEKRALFRQWVNIDSGHGFFTPTMQRRFWALVILILCLFAGFYVWNIALRREVRARTSELLTELSNRKAVEAALTEEKELLAVTLRSIGDGVITTDLEGRILLANSVAAEITGWPPEEARGRPVDEVLVFIEHVAKPGLKQEFASDINERSPKTLVSRDGRRLRVIRIRSSLKDSHGAIIGAVVVFRDVTAQEEIERELQNTQKLQSLGILAGGIAHDFNNLFTGILGNISLARFSLPSDSSVLKTLQAAENAIGSARGLTRQLLTFSRGGAPMRRLQSVVNIVADAARLVLSGSNISCELSFANDLRDVEVDEGQIAQVIQNLVINGKQAMPKGGKIRVGASNIDLDEKSAGKLLPGPYIELWVKDSGVGIPAENLPRIFDPFFTTKALGHGLGLAMVHSIIEKHGGRITVQSEEQGGTTFRFLLPASLQKAMESDLGAGESIKTVPPDATQRAIRVLVMDDEEVVRLVLQQMGEGLGYQVCAVADGEAALAEYRSGLKNGNPFGAVILDMTIRDGMGGRETADRIRELDPAARLLISSGYSNDKTIAHFKDFGFCGALIKPFTLKEVEMALEAALKTGTGFPDPAQRT